MFSSGPRASGIIALQKFSVCEHLLASLHLQGPGSCPCRGASRRRRSASRAHYAGRNRGALDVWHHRCARHSRGADRRHRAPTVRLPRCPDRRRPHRPDPDRVHSGGIRESSLSRPCHGSTMGPGRVCSSLPHITIDSLGTTALVAACALALVPFGVIRSPERLALAFRDRDALLSGSVRQMVARAETWKRNGDLPVVLTAERAPIFYLLRPARPEPDRDPEPDRGRHAQARRRSPSWERTGSSRSDRAEARKCRVRGCEVHSSRAHLRLAPEIAPMGIRVSCTSAAGEMSSPATFEKAVRCPRGGRDVRAASAAHHRHHRRGCRDPFRLILIVGLQKSGTTSLARLVQDAAGLPRLFQAEGDDFWGNVPPSLRRRTPRDISTRSMTACTGMSSAPRTRMVMS